MKKIQVAILALLAISMVASAGQNYKLLKVIVPSAEVRGAPDVTVPAIYPVKFGEQLKYKAKVGDWYQVFLSYNDDDEDSPSGFIIASAVDVIVVKISERDRYNTAERQITKIASACADYIIDNSLFPALQKPEDCQLTKESTIYNLLVPKYAKFLPSTDPWGKPYEIFLGNADWGKKNLDYFGIQKPTGDDFLVVSRGKLGNYETWKYNPNNPKAGLYSEFDGTKNIIYFNLDLIRGKKK